MARIGLIGENSVEYVRHLLEIWRNGDCAVMIDWRIPLKTACQMLKLAGAQKCLIGSNQLRDIPVKKDGITFLPFEHKVEAAKMPPEMYDSYRRCPQTGEAVILFSSGTTGMAKGILLSHQALIANIEAICDYMQPGEQDVFYIAKALSHSSTLTGELLAALHTGAGVILAPTMAPPRYIWQQIARFGVTIMGVNPTLLRLLVQDVQQGKRIPACLQKIYVSGAVLNVELASQAHTLLKGCALYNVYGLSEAGPRVAAQTAQYHSLGSVGRPIKGVKVAISSAQGQVLSDGEKGYVHVKTPSLFCGYLNAQVRRSLLGGAWFNTGDVGYVNALGELFVLGRADEMIVHDAHNIYPSEVEAQIAQFPGVLQCVVFGVDDRASGQRLIAYFTGGQPVTAKALRHFCLERMGSYEVPSEFIQLNKIPVTPAGKVSRKLLARIYLECRENESAGERRELYWT
ncbi:Linear gramicidin synthase subunit B [uncultured Clostridium sp.]|nr:Linear gramicidin synthase subunit B [uncultured Clostridium sp.]